MRSTAPLLIVLGILVSGAASGGGAEADAQEPVSENPAERAEAASPCDRDELAALGVVDLHAHFFNLDYVPLKGIFYRFGLPWPVAGGLAKLLHAATPTIDPTTDPRAAASVEVEEPAMLTRERLTRQVRDRLRAGDPEAMDRLRRYRGRLRKALVRHRLRVAEAAEPGLAADPTRRRSTRQSVERQYQRQSDTDLLVELVYLSLLRGEEEPETLFSPRAAERRSLEGAYRAVRILMSEESAIVAHAKNDYPEVGLFVHHMMDLETVYNDRPPLGFRDQIRHAAWLGERFGDELAVFVAFDPFRRSFDLVRQGAAAGAVGAKFYPPSGYRPASTVIPARPKLRFPFSASCAKRRQHRSRYRSFPGPAIDALNLELFRHAAAEGLPIFSHHNEGGFEADSGYGKLMGEPCRWQKVFRQLTADGSEDPSPLTVIFAHAGGTGSWFASDPAAWPSTYALQAYNLCVTYENVYCDFGYASSILHPDGPGNFAQRLERLLRKPVDPGRRIPEDLCALTTEVEPRYDLGEKLVYGSDWLVSVDRDRAEYACRFDEVFRGPELSPYRAAFFGGNARRALGMDSSPGGSDPPPGSRD